MHKQLLAAAILAVAATGAFAQQPTAQAPHAIAVAPASAPAAAAAVSAVRHG